MASFRACARQVAYPAATMNRSSRFHESAKYAPRPTKPIAITLTHSSTAKKTKMKWSNPPRTRQRVDAHTASWHGRYMPSVRQLSKMTHILIRSNHVTSAVKESDKFKKKQFNVRARSEFAAHLKPINLNYIYCQTKTIYVYKLLNIRSNNKTRRSQHS